MHFQPQSYLHLRGHPRTDPWLRSVMPQVWVSLTTCSAIANSGKISFWWRLLVLSHNWAQPDEQLNKGQWWQGVSDTVGVRSVWFVRYNSFCSPICIRCVYTLMCACTCTPRPNGGWIDCQCNEWILYNSNNLHTHLNARTLHLSLSLVSIRHTSHCQQTAYIHQPTKTRPSMCVSYKPSAGWSSNAKSSVQTATICPH